MSVLAPVLAAIRLLGLRSASPLGDTGAERCVVHVVLAAESSSSSFSSRKLGTRNLAISCAFCACAFLFAWRLDVLRGGVQFPLDELSRVGVRGVVVEAGAELTMVTDEC